MAEKKKRRRGKSILKKAKKVSWISNSGIPIVWDCGRGHVLEAAIGQDAYESFRWFPADQ